MDRRAVTVGALLTAATLVTAAGLGAGFLTIGILVVFTGAVTGYYSRNFRTEYGDAARAAAIGSMVALLVVLFGTGIVFSPSIYPESTRGIPGWLILYSIIGIPLYAILGALGGKYGARFKHRH